MNNQNSLSERAVTLLSENNMTLSLCESCTGGSIAKAITDVPGSSSVFGFGAVTYANEAKEKMAGVSAKAIKAHGAVSPEVAREMAEGIRKLSLSDIGISVTGIAGPGGGSREKPVGLVYMGVSEAEKTYTKKFLFDGSREEIRQAVVEAALNEIIKIIENK